MIDAFLSTFFLVLYSVTCSSGALITFALTRSRHKSYYFARLFSRLMISSCRVRVRLTNTDAVDFSRTQIYMTNHLSGADPPILMKAIPGYFTAMTKRELKYAPFLGWAMQAMGWIFINRKDKEKARAAIDEMAERIIGGDSALIFPEGRRSRDGKTLQPLKKGGFHLALKAGAPIQPALLIGSETVMPADSLFIHPGDVELRFGRPIEPGPDDTVDELMERTRAEFERLANEPGTG